MSPWIGVGIESGFTFSSLILVKVMLTDCQISQLLQPFDSLLQRNYLYPFARGKLQLLAIVFAFSVQRMS